MFFDFQITKKKKTGSGGDFFFEKWNERLLPNTGK
jgi:hypothetical protein